MYSATKQAPLLKISIHLKSQHLLNTSHHQIRQSAARGGIRTTDLHGVDSFGAFQFDHQHLGVAAAADDADQFKISQRVLALAARFQICRRDRQVRSGQVSSHQVSAGPGARAVGRDTQEAETAGILPKLAPHWRSPICTRFRKETKLQTRPA